MSSSPLLILLTLATLVSLSAPTAGNTVKRVDVPVRPVRLQLRPRPHMIGEDSRALVAAEYCNLRCVQMKKCPAELPTDAMKCKSSCGINFDTKVAESVNTRKLSSVIVKLPGLFVKCIISGVDWQISFSEQRTCNSALITRKLYAN